MGDSHSVSIIIPFFNAKAYLQQALDSLLRQSCKDFEVIFIDDGSNDGSKKVVEDFITKHPELPTHLLVNNVNLGEGKTRNYGLRLASGKYVCFLDADDSYSSDFIKLMSEKIKEGFDLVYCGFDVINSTDGSIIKFEKKRSYLRESYQIIDQYLFAKNHFSHAGAIYRMDFLTGNDLWYNENCLFGGDIEFVCSILLKSPACACVNQSLYNYYIRQTSLTNTLTAAKLADCMKALSRVQKKIPRIGDRIKFILTRKANMAFHLMDESARQNIIHQLSLSVKTSLCLLFFAYVLMKPYERFNRKKFSVLARFTLKKQNVP